MSATWVGQLRAALDAEFGPRARIGSFATVDRDGRPRVRSVVCRGVRDDGSLWIASDARSDKNAQARAHPFGEIAFWLPSRRQQFRLAGSLSIRSSGSSRSRSRAWAELSDTARALFFWDEPGEPIAGEDRDHPGMVPASASIPDAFELLILHPDRVEFLDLKAHPHRRLRWEASTAWAERAINP